MLACIVFCRAKWAKVGGTIYKKNCVVLLKVEGDFPQFAYVEDVLIGHDSLIHLFILL